MRMLLRVSIPAEAGNAAAKAGTLGTTVERILADLKPEAAYFFADDNGARSASIELEMFRPDAGQALHAAGLSNRVHVPPPEQLVEYWRGGRDPLPSLVHWVSEGLIDSISGDDVPFIARLVARAGKAGA